jgi:DNA end-binding protein Ku
MVAMAARAIWKGSISFGLVNIPIQVFSATQKEDYTSFNQLCDKGHKIKYKKWCPTEEREVEWSEIKKGYEITKNNYVVIEKEDFEKIKLKTTNTVEVKEFIDSDDFDPIFIEKNYYIGPDAGKKKSESAIKAYALFVRILNETKKIAVGKVVLRDKEHLVALRAYQRGLVMHQLKYLDEIRPMDEIGIDSPQKIDSKELSLGKTLVENEYLRDTFSFRHHDCISCGHRTECWTQQTTFIRWHWHWSRSYKTWIWFTSFCIRIFNAWINWRLGSTRRYCNAASRLLNKKPLHW